MINLISLNGSVITSVEAEPSQVAAGTMVAEEPDIEVAEEVVTEVATKLLKLLLKLLLGTF